MRTKNLKRIVLLGITISLSVGLVAIIYMHGESLLGQELDRLIYPGSYEIEPLIQSKTYLQGKWRTNDSVETASEYYQEMGFAFKDSHPENPGLILQAGDLNMNSVSRQVTLIHQQKGTLVRLYVGNADQPNIWRAIVFKLRRMLF